MTLFALYSPVICPKCGLALYQQGNIIIHPDLKGEGNGRSCEYDAKKFAPPTIDLTEVE